MKRLPLGILLFAAIILMSNYVGGSGVSVQCNSATGCSAAASSSVIAIVFGLAIFVVFWVIPKKTTVTNDKYVGFFRKLFSLFLDMFLVLIGFSAIFALPMLIAESTYTGSFEWSFHRDYVRPTDWLYGVPSAIGMFILIGYYRIHSFVNDRSSFGQYVAGYKVLRKEEERSYKLGFRRLGWTLLYCLFWPLYLIYKIVKGVDEDLWDIRVGTQSRKIEY